MTNFFFEKDLDNLDLRDVALSSRQYTWANRLATPTVEKLDKVLLTTEWKLKSPLVSVYALSCLTLVQQLLEINAANLNLN